MVNLLDISLIGNLLTREPSLKWLQENVKKSSSDPKKADTMHTGQFYYEIHSGPKKIEKKLTISNLKMPFTKVLAYN